MQFVWTANVVAAALNGDTRGRGENREKTPPPKERERENERVSADILTRE